MAIQPERDAGTAPICSAMHLSEVANTLHVRHQHETHHHGPLGPRDGAVRPASCQEELSFVCL